MDHRMHPEAKVKKNQLFFNGLKALRKLKFANPPAGKQEHLSMADC